MRLLPTWRLVLRRAWSIRLIVLAGLLSGLDAALPYFEGLSFIPQQLFAVLTLIVSAAAFVARIIAQKGADHVDQNQNP